MVPGAINTQRGTAVSHNTIMASAPVVNQRSFEDMLAKEANLTSSWPQKHVNFMDTMMEGVTSSRPCKTQEKMVLPSGPVEHPEVGLQVAAHEFRKMQESKISKL